MRFKINAPGRWQSQLRENKLFRNSLPEQSNLFYFLFGDGPGLWIQNVILCFCVHECGLMQCVNFGVNFLILCFNL